MNYSVNNKILLLSNNIRKFREYRNYTQEYVASQLGISQNAYSKIELGHTKITVEKLFIIAMILDTQLMKFLHMDNQVEKGLYKNISSAK